MVEYLTSNDETILQGSGGYGGQGFSLDGVEDVGEIDALMPNNTRDLFTEADEVVELLKTIV